MPKRGNESFSLVLFGHVEDWIRGGYLNADRPEPQDEPDRAVKAPLNCVFARAAPSPAQLSFEFCDFTFRPTPGLIEFLETGWRIHLQPDLSAPLPIRGETIRFLVTLGADAPMPLVGVSARLETGRFVGRGDVIAESPPDHAGLRRTMVHLPGEAHNAWEFDIPMRVRMNEIPDSDSKPGFVLSFRVFQYDSPQVGATSPGLHMRVGAKFPPRLVLESESPLETVDSSIRRRGQESFFRWSVQPRLAAYDLDRGSLRMESTGPAPLPMDALEFVVFRYSVDWAGHFKPVNMTWKFNSTEHPLPDGDYRLRASVRNLQGTYELVHDFAFRAEHGRPVAPNEVEFKGRNTPGFSVLLVFLALLPIASSRKGKGFQPPKSG